MYCTDENFVIYSARTKAVFFECLFVNPLIKLIVSLHYILRKYTQNRKSVIDHSQPELIKKNWMSKNDFRCGY